MFNIGDIVKLKDLEEFRSKNRGAYEWYDTNKVWGNLYSIIGTEPNLTAEKYPYRLDIGNNRFHWFAEGELELVFTQ